MQVYLNWGMHKQFKQFNLLDFFSQSVRCFKIMKKSYAFFKKHKLWKGIFEHKWILLLTVLLSVLFTFVLFSDLYSYLFSSEEIGELGIIDSEVSNPNAKENNKNTAIFGGSKFLLLIMLEVVIFHFSVKTLEILNNEKYKTTFGMFMKAEIRMIKVLIRGFIQSLIAQVIIWFVLLLIGLSSLSPFLMFIVHAYIIGNAFFDNYNEQQKLNIKESDICIRHHSGAATTLGIITSIGLMIPIIGPLVIPVLAAITANIYGFRYHIENPPHHKAGEEIVDLSEEIV